MSRKFQFSSELERNNRLAMNTHLCEVVIISILCFLQAWNGERSWVYAIVLSVIGFAPVIAERIFWKKNHETQAIYHLLAIGFAVYYTCLIFTATTSAIYAFVLPLILIASIYNDIRYMLLINAGVVIENVLAVIIGATTGRLGYAGPDSAVIQILISVMIGIFALFLAKVSKANSDQKLQKLEESHLKSDELLKNISEMSEKMQTGINEIYNELAKLNEAGKATQSTMEDVSTGATDTANAVQSQLIQTEEIQKKVNVVDDAAGHITDSMKKTLDCLEAGSREMINLVSHVDDSVHNSENAAAKLQNLSSHIEQMHSIIGLIEDIASQTELLALNASIEAARAGEAGKGFAVVATEITKMASQTSNATDNITTLIENVSAAIQEVVSVIEQMINGINAEKQSTIKAHESFDNIQNNTFAIRDNVDSLTSSIDELKTANQAIVESIQTISAVSEELSAHAAETMENEDSNISILNSIAGRMQNLIETVSNKS